MSSGGKCQGRWVGPWQSSEFSQLSKAVAAQVTRGAPVYRPVHLRGSKRKKWGDVAEYLYTV